ncbi:MAG: peptidase M14, partial [Eudoraea sp.]
VEQLDENILNSPIPLHIISTTYKVPKFNLSVGKNPTFLLAKDQKIETAVINGFLVDLETGDSDFVNAMIYK